MSDNRNKNTDKNAEHILVCISSSPSNTKIIQTASSMAKAFGAMFSALYIKTPSAASLEPKDKERLLSNIHFAEECGASVTTVCGDDIPFQIAEYARLSGVTKIVIGRSVVNKKRLALQPTLTEKLISLAPNVDIHIIPDSDAVLPKGKAKVFEKPAFSNCKGGNRFDNSPFDCNASRLYILKIWLYRCKHYNRLYARNSHHRHIDRKQDLLGALLCRECIAL